MPDVPIAAPLELSLADWRRRIADLYAEVRRVADRDAAAAHRLWREARETLYREHPRSPVPPAGRSAFRALHHPYDPALRFDLVPDPLPGRATDPGDAGVGQAGAGLAVPRPGDAGPAVPGQVPGWVALPTSGGEELRFRPVARLALPLPGGARHLTLFWMEGYAGGLFLPFGDATNGATTYGAGRYVLDTAKGADLGPGRIAGSLVVDLNFAYQPSCAFDPRWACPLAPPENRLDIAIVAGERLA